MSVVKLQPRSLMLTESERALFDLFPKAPTAAQVALARRIPTLRPGDERVQGIAQLLGSLFEDEEKSADVIALRPDDEPLH